MQRGARILMVDDDLAFVGGLEHELGQRGWAVRCCGSEEALGILAGEPYDAVTLELETRDLDGWNLFRSIRSEHQGCAVVLLGRELDVDTAVRAMRHGARDALQKPIDPADLDRRLRDAMRMGHAPRPTQPSKTDVAVSGILGETPAIRAIREQIRTVARYRDLPVLVTGETGTGKELVAQAIHAASATDAPFVPINCAALPEQLFESELFGHEAGSFTGARGARAGLFEVASTGTLFLDEIGELPASLQPKLLRALESRAFRRIGGSKDIPFRARVVSATHRHLFGPGSALRSDLYYRLAGFTIATPSLRDDVADVEILARHFLGEFASRYGLGLEFSPRAVSALQAHDWPGNVRELRAVVQQAAVLSVDGRVGVAEIAAALRDRQQRAGEPSDARVSGFMVGGVREPLRDLERRTIHETWSESGHNLSAAARALGLPRTTLRDRLRKYGLR